MAIIIFNSYQYLYKIFINNKQKSPDKEFMKTSTQLEFSLLNSKWKMMQSSQCFPLQNTSQFPWTIIISPLFSGLLGNSTACKTVRNKTRDQEREVSNRCKYKPWKQARQVSGAGAGPGQCPTVPETDQTASRSTAGMLHAFYSS